MLTDVHITVANQMLKQQFPSIRGLQSTLPGQDISFQPVDPPFTQILGLHWVTVEACHDSFVRVYDSLYPAVSSSVQEKTQYQQGGTDCGLFAIAYATDLCYGNNPAAYRYVCCKYYVINSEEDLPPEIGSTTRSWLYRYSKSPSPSEEKEERFDCLLSS